MPSNSRIVIALGCGFSLSVAMMPHDAAAQTACGPGTLPLIIYHAGSLSKELQSLEATFTQQVGACITDVSSGSLDAARQLTAGQQTADIFAAADYLDIDLLLKPAHYADYSILFATSDMVLGYSTNSKYADTIATAGQSFNPPMSVPDAAPNWYQQVTQSNVLVGATNPFLDPTGYRNDMIFQLAGLQYPVPDLYNTFLEHYAITRPTDVIGQTYDYEIVYESTALAAYQAAPSTFRYVHLPPSINLGSADYEQTYLQVSTVVPGLGLPNTAAKVNIPATRTAWGVTILKNAPHPATAAKFLQLLFSSAGVAVQTADGPTPISPPVVSVLDYPHLPAALKPLVSAVQ